MNKKAKVITTILIVIINVPFTNTVAAVVTIVSPWPGTWHRQWSSSHARRNNIFRGAREAKRAGERATGAESTRAEEANPETPIDFSGADEGLARKQTEFFFVFCFFFLSNFGGQG